MTSVVDDRHSIIPQGERRRRRRRRRALGVIVNLITGTCVCKKQGITKKSFIKSLLSVAACWIKPKKDHLIIDIDEFDNNNELAQVEYVKEMYMVYKLRETEGCFRDYMDSQPHINAKSRACLLDWIIKLHTGIIPNLMPETLYRAINIVDRYLSVTTISKTQLQLLGISALLISSKYEEISPLLVDDLIIISATAYSRDQVLTMEKAVLSSLGWYLTVPTPYEFVVRYAKAASLPSESDNNHNQMLNMVFFFTELGLINYWVTIRNNPSKLAASAVYAARLTLKMTPLWTQTLEYYTGYSEDQLTHCAECLVRLHARASEKKLKAVYNKYMNPDRSAVSLCPPARQ